MTAKVVGADPGLLPAALAPAVLALAADGRAPKGARVPPPELAARAGRRGRRRRRGCGSLVGAATDNGL